MKRLIFLFAFLALAGSILAQRKTIDMYIPVPTGSDTTLVVADSHGSTNLFTGEPWSIHYWYQSLDNTDGTLALYGSNFASDTGAYELLFIDAGNDGTNDNPKTLSDTTWVIWGDSFPFKFLIQKFTKVSNTSGRIHAVGQEQ